MTRINIFKKIVKRFGNGAHITIPKKLAGQKVIIMTKENNEEEFDAKLYMEVQEILEKHDEELWTKNKKIRIGTGKEDW